MKLFEFITRIKKIMKFVFFPCNNNENHEIPKIKLDNHYENNIIQINNNENLENHIITHDNHENPENH